MSKIQNSLKFFLLLTSLFLFGCAGGGYNAQPWKGSAHSKPAAKTPNELSIEGLENEIAADASEAQQNALIATQDNLPPVKVAILLPLSGKNAALGQSMLQSAQMALFDVGYSNFELVPKDTAGTAQGAQGAARAALQDGAKLVLGPIFADEVKAARLVTHAAGVNMIAFSTDWTLANNKTFLIGFLPFDQVENVVRYAGSAGYKRIGVLSPADSYGNGVVSAYQAIARTAGITQSKIERFSPQASDLPAIVQKFSDFEQRQASNNLDKYPFDAVLMPVGGNAARHVGQLLNRTGLPASNVRRLGTGLMDDPALAKDPSLNGLWFAAPAPQTRTKFERKYANTYGSKPQRIASLAYDATALAAILARTGMQANGAPAFDSVSIANPNGYSGVDGIFRFRADGIVERGLAVLEYRTGRIVTIAEAPTTFQHGGF